MSVTEVIHAFVVALDRQAKLRPEATGLGHASQVFRLGYVRGAAAMTRLEMRRGEPLDILARRVLRLVPRREEWVRR